jgi:HlyD family secretion protein
MYLKLSNLRVIGLVLAAILLAGVNTACGAIDESAQAVPAQAASSDTPALVSAEAFVVPLQEADLSFEVGGPVVSVAVEEGDTVTEGQLLAQVDDTTQQIGLIEAKVNLTNAEANLAKAGAGLSQAQASLADTKAGAIPEQIVQAEADVAKAEACLAELMAGSTPGEIAEAEAKIETARANLAQVLAGSRDEDIQAAAAQMLQAEADVREAQADYDKHVYGDLDRLGPYGLALEQATLSYEAAKADYDKLVNGSTEEEIAVYRAQLYEAQTALEKVLAGATAEQIVQAQADVTRAQAALAELEAGSTAEQIAISQAGVESAAADVQVAQAGIETAETGLLSAKAELAKTKLTAPFNGLVGRLSLKQGEMAQTGQSAIILGDTSRWQIETDDLTELEVGRVKPGANVQISVDALPGEPFEGQVVRITPKSETKAGDVTYTVLIDITSGNTSALHWGMTTFVDIEVEPAL